MKVPVDAVLIFSTVGTQLFLSKEESCGVYSTRLLCNAAGEKTNKILTGEGLHYSRAWRRMSASRGLVFTASGLRVKGRRRVLLPLSCSVHEARQAPYYKGSIQPYGRARLRAAIA